MHNRYREAGGEDLVVRDEITLLRRHGVEVHTHEVDNEGSGAALAAGASWASDSFRTVKELCESLRPDLAHVHNFWMKLSPSVHAACHAAGVPTVQTLHNFRLLCTNALFLRNGRACEDCLGKLPWRGVMHRCYRNSVLPSAAVAAMITANRWRGTWQRDVDAFIALTEHSASKFLRGGLPAGQIFVKPNFVEDPGPARNAPSASDAVLYVGRLSGEKGVAALLAAWASGNLSAYGRLLVIGDGPERDFLERQAAEYKFPEARVEFLGHLAHDEVMRLQAGCRAVVMPSLAYETFGRTVIEGFSHGRPAVVSKEGGVGELVDDGRTGFTVDPANAAALAGALEKVMRDGALADRLGANGRQEYLSRYTPQRNYTQLSAIYRFAIERAGGRVPALLSA